jgi:hypothetical protein
MDQAEGRTGIQCEHDLDLVTPTDQEIIYLANLEGLQDLKAFLEKRKQFISVLKIDNLTTDQPEIKNISKLLDFLEYVAAIQRDIPSVTKFREGQSYLESIECSKKASAFLSKYRFRLVGDDKRKERNEIVCKSAPFLTIFLQIKVKLELKYVYPSLNGSASIRILELLPTPDSSLKCRITNEDVNTSDYIALSYEWGPSIQVYSISILTEDSTSLGNIPITQDLYNALCDLRDSPSVSTPRFWIDQICINQLNEKEKEVQIPLMGKIYSNAKRVISYLGESETSDREGLELLQTIEQQFGNLYEDDRLHIDIDEFKSLTPSFGDLPQGVPPEWRFTNQVPRSSWKAMLQIILGPWSRRLWMLQEVSCVIHSDILDLTILDYS